MSALNWDANSQHFYETGVDHGILYVGNSAQASGYDGGVVWNGLISVTEKASGAESTPLYADNMKYLNMLSTEDFGIDISAYASPTRFDECDGAAIFYGVKIGQQARKKFAMYYRTKVGNDVDGSGYGFKHHFVFGATAQPTEKAYDTESDDPSAIELSWSAECIPESFLIPFPDGTSETLMTSHIEIDETELPSEDVKTAWATYVTNTLHQGTFPTPNGMIAALIAAMG